MAHATYDGPVTGKSLEQNGDEFTAWAEWPNGHRVTFTGTGPQVLSWHIEAKRMGATRVGR